MTIDFIGCVLYRSLRKVKSIARLSEKVARKDIGRFRNYTISNRALSKLRLSCQH